MSSSFKKTFRASRPAVAGQGAAPPSSSSASGASGSQGPSARGVKAWLGGQRLVSSGHRQLDEIVGGGLVLGSALLVEGDLHSDFADTLLAYSIAEALGNDQEVVLIARSMREAEAFVKLLPYNLTLADELEETEASSSQEPLQIAWQYDKYTQRGGVELIRGLLSSQSVRRGRAAEPAEDGLLLLLLRPVAKVTWPYSPFACPFSLI